MENNDLDNKINWLDRSFDQHHRISVYKLLFAIIIIIAIFTRFYNLGERVMSHDENSHVYFSWLLEQGKSYKHDPVTHGPLQFHLIAFSYFIFGDSDFTARLPAAIISIATIAFMWNYRKILGKAGAMIAAILLLISPYLLYYGRYSRNEAFVGLLGVVMIWSILRYLEGGENKYLIYLTITNALHFTAKETSFIYTAQALIFLGFLFLLQIAKVNWLHNKWKKVFFGLAFISIILTIAGVYTFNEKFSNDEIISLATPIITGQEIIGQSEIFATYISYALIITGGILLILALFFLLRGYSLSKLREIRSLDAIIILFTMVLPMLAPFPVKLLGYNPIDYANYSNVLFVSLWVGLLTVIAIIIGVIWKAKIWLTNVAVFYSIFTLLYTTFFTNGFGVFTGLVGSLGYWLEQQGVNRGSQPWYYYSLIQIPMYEYLTAFGCFLAFFTGLRVKQNTNSTDKYQHNPEIFDVNSLPNQKSIIYALLGYWTLSSLAAYTLAGEKMPWLTFHIALPMILLTAWYLGNVIDHIKWDGFWQQKGALVIISLPLLLLTTFKVVSSLMGPVPPFQGKELYQLEASSTFITAFISMMFLGWLILKLASNWTYQQLSSIFIIVIFLFGGILTARTAFMASYINYDEATEYLVYAHSAEGVKIALKQIEEISRRTTGSLDLQVAYDNVTTYPFWWYLRNYPNQNYYGENPTREQRDAPVILVGDENFGKIEPVVGQAYHRFDYIRLWWPNQDYFDLNLKRIKDALTDPQMRQALFHIWFYRDFNLYGQLTNKDMSLSNWNPSSRMRLYIRKDIVNKIWNYGTSPTDEVVVADPYEGKEKLIEADIVLDKVGSEPGQFLKPRDIALAKDGTIYVVDSENNRIQHLDREGKVLNYWGSFGDVSIGQAPGGYFNQPWGIGLSTDGSVYVADTWNHRVQKFSSNGEFITMWGYFGQGETPEAFWGPRDIAVDTFGRVFITDTGNKRIVVFNELGDYLFEFGGPGLLPGQFDEPVGLALDQTNRLFVVDTWNQRVQLFIPGMDKEYLPVTSWDISGWYGQSLDNKPYIAIDENQIYITDPEGYRVLVYSLDGEFQYYWGTYSIGPDGFGVVTSVEIDPLGGVWVSDSGNNRIMHFTIID